MNDYRFSMPTLRFVFLPKIRNMRSRWLALIVAVSVGFSLQAQSPCKMDTHYRQFDFWVGDWDVYKYGTDTLAGTNEVLKLLNDCVIQENWESAGSNYAGKSYNSFDPSANKWRQTWVDNQGVTLQFEGYLKDAKMQLAGFSHEKNGKLVYHRLIYTKMQDGTVRQQWDKSYNREDWTPLFDGLYVPKGSGPHLK